MLEPRCHIRRRVPLEDHAQHLFLPTVDHVVGRWYLIHTCTHIDTPHHDLIRNGSAQDSYNVDSMVIVDIPSRCVIIFEGRSPPSSMSCIVYRPALFPSTLG